MISNFEEYPQDIETPFYEQPSNDVAAIPKRNKNKTFRQKPRKERIDTEAEHVRKSKRLKCSPLAFWRNEKVIYSRKNSAGIHSCVLY